MPSKLSGNAFQGLSINATLFLDAYKTRASQS